MFINIFLIKADKQDSDSTSERYASSSSRRDKDRSVSPVEKKTKRSKRSSSAEYIKSRRSRSNSPPRK